MKNRLLILFLLIGFSGMAQEKKVVADETTLTQLKASVKVETTNETVFKAICDTFKGEGFKYTVTTKKDRQGLYSAYQINFKNEEREQVLQFFEKLNSKAK